MSYLFNLFLIFAALAIGLVAFFLFDRVDAGIEMSDDGREIAFRENAILGFVAALGSMLVLSAFWQ